MPRCRRHGHPCTYHGYTYHGSTYHGYTYYGYTYYGYTYYGYTLTMVQAEQSGEVARREGEGLP